MTPTELLAILRLVARQELIIEQLRQEIVRLSQPQPPEPGDIE